MSSNLEPLVWLSVAHLHGIGALDAAPSLAVVLVLLVLAFRNDRVSMRLGSWSIESRRSPRSATPKPRSRASRAPLSPSSKDVGAGRAGRARGRRADAATPRRLRRGAE